MDQSPQIFTFRWTRVPNFLISMDWGPQIFNFRWTGVPNFLISMDWGPQIFNFRWTGIFELDVFDGPGVSIFHFQLSRLEGVDWKSQHTKSKKIVKSRLILIWNSQKKIDWSWWGGSIENLGFLMIGLIFFWVSKNSLKPLCQKPRFSTDPPGQDRLIFMLIPGKRINGLFKHYVGKT